MRFLVRCETFLFLPLEISSETLGATSDVQENQLQTSGRTVLVVEIKQSVELSLSELVLVLPVVGRYFHFISIIS